ncbi:MAG: M48 family metalloprotease [Armatimonadetes bacterium]|nr:M48 family metalloprotease [Armatimonadota bacterium]
MARKSKVRKTKEPSKPKGLRPADFIFPGEKVSYWGGVAGMFIVFIWLAVMSIFVAKNTAQQTMWHIPIEIALYPVLAVIIANILAARPRQAQFKKVGRQGRVMNNNHADLYRVLSRQASLLGMKTPPDMYLVDDKQPIIFSLPAGRGIIVASQALREALFPDEFEALMAHEVVHIACKHVRVDMAMTFIRHTNIGIKIGLFPVLLMMFFARAWKDLIEFTADRGTLLITLRPAVINAALVKFAVVADPNAGITSEELQAFLDSQGDIATDSAQMERHFRIGQFMSSQPGLRERIEQLTEFPQTKQGQEAIAKSAGLQGVAIPTFGSGSKRFDDGIETIATDDDEPGIPGGV